MGVMVGVTRGWGWENLGVKMCVPMKDDSKIHVVYANG